ncbi:hypothetical protein EC991_008036, partial [Linnemannia zychae]
PWPQPTPTSRSRWLVSTCTPRLLLASPTMLARSRACCSRWTTASCCTFWRTTRLWMPRLRRLSPSSRLTRPRLRSLL